MDKLAVEILIDFFNKIKNIGKNIPYSITPKEACDFAKYYHEVKLREELKKELMSFAIELVTKCMVEDNWKINLTKFINKYLKQRNERKEI